MKEEKYWLINLIKFFVIVNLFVYSFSSCENETTEKINSLYVHKAKKWNYLIYMAADNNLERFAIKNVLDLKRVGSNDNLNIIVLLDRSPRFDKSEGDWTDTKLLYITKETNSLNDDVIYEYGELNMTSPDVLLNFLTICETYFPSEKTVLTIWSHGRGVYPDGTIPSSVSSRAIIDDYTTGYGAKNTMSIIDFAQSLEQYSLAFNKKIDVLQFDACEMQMIEVCYQIQNSCNYIVGAETDIPGMGSDYFEIANYISANSNALEKDSAEFMVASFDELYKDSKNSYSYCAVDSKKINAFVASWNALCKKMLESEVFSKNDFLERRSKFDAVSASYPEFCDIRELLDLINNERSIEIQENLDEVIIASVKSKDLENTSGLSINFPYSKQLLGYYQTESKYEILDFYKDTLWDECLNWLLD